MNIKKLQNDLIKNFFSRRSIRYLYAIKDEYTYISEGHFIIRFRTADNCLNLAHIANEIDSLPDFFNDTDYSREPVLDNYEVITLSNGQQANLYTDTHDVKHAINPDFLKYFDKKERVHVNVLAKRSDSTSISPMIFESGNDYGEALFILPISI